MNFELLHIEFNLSQKVIATDETSMEYLELDDRTIVLQRAVNTMCKDNEPLNSLATIAIESHSQWEWL